MATSIVRILQHTVASMNTNPEFLGDREVRAFTHQELSALFAALRPCLMALYRYREDNNSHSFSIWQGANALSGFFERVARKAQIAPDVLQEFFHDRLRNSFLLTKSAGLVTFSFEGGPPIIIHDARMPCMLTYQIHPDFDSVSMYERFPLGKTLVDQIVNNRHPASMLKVCYRFLGKLPEEAAHQLARLSDYPEQLRAHSPEQEQENHLLVVVNDSE